MNKWLPATCYFVRSLPPCKPAASWPGEWKPPDSCRFAPNIAVSSLHKFQLPMPAPLPALLLLSPCLRSSAKLWVSVAEHKLWDSSYGSPGKDIRHHPSALMSHSYCFDMSNSSSPFPSLAQSGLLPQRQQHVKVVASPLNCMRSARRSQCTSDDSLMQYIFQDRLLFSFLAAHPLSVVSFAHFSCKLSRGREKAFSFKQFPFQFPFIEFQPPFFFFKHRDIIYLGL